MKNTLTGEMLKNNKKLTSKNMYKIVFIIQKSKTCLMCLLKGLNIDFCLYYEPML